jgi:methionine synthase II (cobalamin-independent)
MAILDYDSNANKATLKCGLSQELQTGLVHQAEELQDFEKLVDLYIKLDYQIHTHIVATKYQTTPALPQTSPALTCPSPYPISTNSGNYRATSIDLLAS